LTLARIISMRAAFFMIAPALWSLATVAAAGAAFTMFGAWRISAAHPPAGKFVPVTGGRLHVVELGEAHRSKPAIVLIHGASGNLEELRQLGELLAERQHVVLVDRPGHGWSDRSDRLADASPARQAELIGEALDRMKISRVVVVGHSLGGTVAAAFALAQPERTSGLVLLSPVTHPWSGGAGDIAWYYPLTDAPLIGPLFAYTFALPTGLALLRRGVDAVFAPNIPPPDYVRRAAVTLLLRPTEFSANASDVAALHAFVTQQSQRYAELKMPVCIVSGDTDDVVPIDMHARVTAAMVQDARLIVLPGVGHMPHHAAPDVVIGAIEDLVRPHGSSDPIDFDMVMERQPDPKGDRDHDVGKIPAVQILRCDRQRAAVRL
jgi:pimeloyl-ACP methyl ester carboxylesterase